MTMNTTLTDDLRYSAEEEIAEMQEEYINAAKSLIETWEDRGNFFNDNWANAVIRMTKATDALKDADII